MWGVTLGPKYVRACEEYNKKLNAVPGGMETRHSDSHRLQRLYQVIECILMVSGRREPRDLCAQLHKD